MTTKTTKTVKTTKKSKTVKAPKTTKKPKTVKAAPKVENPKVADVPVKTSIRPSIFDAVITPIVKIEEKVEEPVKKKTVKAPKVPASSKKWEMPNPSAWTPIVPASGWRNYRLWMSYELDYDEKSDNDAIIAAIKAHFTKNKAALVKALAAFDAKQLILKTDLKKDEHPFEPFVEVWICLSDEWKVREQLVAVPEITEIDPDCEELPKTKVAPKLEEPKPEAKPKKTAKKEATNEVE